MYALLEAVAVKLGWALLFSPRVTHCGGGAGVRDGAEHCSVASLLCTLMRPAEATVLG
jgi:hypothetical protein